jgi:MFS family permease
MILRYYAEGIRRAQKELQLPIDSFPDLGIWDNDVNSRMGSELGDSLKEHDNDESYGYNAKSAGYLSVAIVGFATGYLASIFGLKPYPFYIGIAFAILGFLISWLIVRDTSKFTALEIKENESVSGHNTESSSDDNSNNNNTPRGSLDFKEVFVQTSWKDRSLLAVSQAGLVNNLVFGVTWGLFTLYFASFGASVNEIGFLKSLHPGIWGVLQLVTGSLSDRIGRKILIYPGMIVQSIGIWTVLFTHSYFGWITGMSLLGIGTALVYPTLLAVISDIANPRWRATSLGVYRFWRDLGFVFRAVGIGFIAYVSNISIAIQYVAWIALASGIFVLVIMREPKHTPH